MKSRRLRGFAVLAFALLTGCNLALMPEGLMNSLGEQSYREATSQYRVITGTTDARMVARLGKKIAAATGKHYDWEFKLLDAPETINAFALPGGKVAVYSGILKVTRNEDALAAVVGHEIAHVIKQHGNKRMTQGLILGLGLGVAESAVQNWKGTDPQTRAGIMTALGAGAQYGVVLPFSRGHESEADAEGLRYMIRAGYDPNEAPKLWERMARLSPNRPPEFMSTHPDPLARAKRLRELIPQLLAEERRR